MSSFIFNKIARLGRETHCWRVLKGNNRNYNATRWIATKERNKNSKLGSSEDEKPMLIKEQFYRSLLPPNCTSFCSPDGRRIFTEAMSDGHMVNYFNLAAQFCTQDEPAFCGLSTLVMVLNALSVDPGRIWKGPWRWYHEGMLDCCVPIHIAAQKGITLDQFTCIGQCNSLQVKTTRVEAGDNVRVFRELVKKITKCDDKILVCSYTRRTLGQNGDGHFTPVGGYHPDEDLVLLLDVARFKYPPHWVKLPLLWQAMSAIDKSTDLPRGYSIMERFDANGPPLLFTIAQPLSILLPKDILPEIRLFIQNIETWHLLDDDYPTDKIVYEAVRSCLETLVHVPGDVSLIATEVNVSQYLNSAVSTEHAEKIVALIKDIEKTEVFKQVTAQLKEKNFTSLTSGNIGKISTACSRDNCKRLVDNENDKNTIPLSCNGKLETTLTQSHFITMLVLASCYSRDKNSGLSSNGLNFSKEIQKMLNECSVDMQTEVRQLRRQLRTCVSYIGRTMS